MYSLHEKLRAIQYAVQGIHVQSHACTRRTIFRHFFWLCVGPVLVLRRLTWVQQDAWSFILLVERQPLGYTPFSRHVAVATHVVIDPKRLLRPDLGYMARGIVHAWSHTNAQRQV